MRAVVKKNIGVFYPQGFLDGNNTPSFFTVEDIKAAQELHVELLLVSLKKVIFFNHNGIDTFVKLLQTIRSENRALIGFCDYDTKKYQAIHSFYKESLSFSLFQSYEIATLFSASFSDQNQNVLVYSDDPSQRSAIAIELFDRGHNPIIMQTKSEFDERSKESDKYDMILTDTYLNLMGQKIATKVKGNAVIYTLGGFLDAQISENFDFTYHQNSLHVGFRLFVFDACKVVSMNIHALNFFTKLSSGAAEYNATICIAGMQFDKTPEKFKQDLEDFGILFFESLDAILKDKEQLKELGGSLATTKKSRSLTKLVIGQLSEFVEAVVSTIEMMTNAKAIKESVNMQMLHIEDKTTKFASSIGFYGAMDGIIILVFPRTVAKKSCELLLGEETDDDEAILDALAEFVNIIGGRIKALLHEHEIKVDITLPRTYADMDNLLEVTENKKGVQVDLGFHEERFTFFLAR